jgi:hypothetical protein
MRWGPAARCFDLHSKAKKHSTERLETLRSSDIAALPLQRASKHLVESEGMTMREQTVKQ